MVRNFNCKTDAYQAILKRQIGRTVHCEILYIRKLSKLPEGVTKLVKSTNVDHGWNGWVGICVGHPTLIADAVPLVSADESTFMDYCNKKAKEGCTMTAAELVAEWTSKSKPKPRVVSVPVGDSESETSSVTDAAAVSVAVYCLHRNRWFGLTKECWPVTKDCE